jgi:gliding motility-associated protein GldL
MAGQNKSLDKVINMVVSIGAAVVIFGAWAKILHKSYADIMLTVGLLTEAAIFIIYAFLPPAGNEMAEVAEVLKQGVGGPSSGANDELKKLVEKEINPDNLKKLNESFSKFNTTIQGLSSLADVNAANNEFASKTKEAATAIGSVKDAYAAAAASVQQFSHATEGTKAFHEQIQGLTQNLGSLNKMYEAELQDSSNHIKALNGFYESLSKTSQVMQSSVDDAKKTQEQIALLAKNLGSLNSVYGNMLSAMQGGRS